MFDTIALKFGKYYEIFRINLSDSFVYLTSFLSRCITILFRVWIVAQMYIMTFQTIGQTVVNGMTVPMVVWSLMISQIIQSSARPTLSKVIEREIRNGDIANVINKPCNYISYHLFAFIGRLIPNFCTLLLIGVITALMLVGPINFTSESILFGIILLVLGCLLNFFIEILIGLIAFWIEDTEVSYWIYSKMLIVFGGLIIPINLLPEFYQRIIEYTPFPYLFYATSKTIVNFDFYIAIKYLLIQIIWIIIFALLSIFLYKKGAKNISINGG